MKLEPISSPLQSIEDEITRRHQVTLSVKRDDLNHPEVSGNKLRKLKYNLLHAQELQSPAILSFGGAYSNHILALSAAGHLAGIETIGIIRGEELANMPLNPVLERAQANGMRLIFVDRAEYRRRNNKEYLNELGARWKNIYIVPEGGSNALGVKGASEIIDELGKQYDYLICPCGTGGTFAGLIAGLFQAGRLSTTALGIAVLKSADSYWQHEMNTLLLPEIRKKIKWHINADYHFGGYAKTSDHLERFITKIQQQHNIPLESIYTGKMFYAVYSLMEAGYFAKGSSILLVHTGGLQAKQLCSQR
jgi:1-aminocyclopropane-1-carboxylate deaminase/D-cysteine desulfhydrase-like pyridoxal-dependent ACC family enzyme